MACKKECWDSRAKWALIGSSCVILVLVIGLILGFTLQPGRGSFPHRSPPLSRAPAASSIHMPTKTSPRPRLLELSPQKLPQTFPFLASNASTPPSFLLGSLDGQSSFLLGIFSLGAKLVLRRPHSTGHEPPVSTCKACALQLGILNSSTALRAASQPTYLRTS